MYGKVFSSMYDGTLAGHWEAIVTMQQLIVLANADGVVDKTPEAIARHTTIPIHIIKKGLEFLAQPDPRSRTPGDDGRRIVALDDHRDWGWRLVNHGKYRRLRNMEEKREADRDRVSEKRKKNKDVAIVSQKSPGVADVAHADTEADAVKASPATAGEGRDLVAAVPDCPHEKLIALYHDLLPTCTRVVEWNEQRKAMMRSRWREKAVSKEKNWGYQDVERGLACWRRFFVYVSQSEFLTGKSNPSQGRAPFIATLEWLIRPRNFARVVEGNYHT